MISSSSSKKYGVIHADPPWLFRNYSEKGTGRNAISHYDCLSFDELRRLPVADAAAKDCVLFLWAVDPLLPKAFDLLNAWGFQFKTVGFYWAKTNRSARQDTLRPSDFFTGLGYWTRANVEQCLLATRGKPPRRAKNVRRLIIGPRREHSRKPEQVYERIERLAGGPYLDLFARESRKGWDIWGDQAGLFDTGTVVTRRQPSDLRRGEGSGVQV
jgi:N6-adenosine-specific RNA methylase IME4